VKQSDLGEYKKKCKKKAKDTNIQANHKASLKPSHRDGKHQAPSSLPPPQRSKTRIIKGFGKNISQLPLCVNKLHLYLPSQHGLSKMVSHFDVFGSPIENWVMG
jgi:hypothetical protein